MSAASPVFRGWQCGPALGGVWTEPVGPPPFGPEPPRVHRPGGSKGFGHRSQQKNLTGSTEQEQTHHRPGLAGQWVLKSGGQSLLVQTKWVYRTLMAFMTTRIYNVSWRRLRRKGHRPTRASTVLYFLVGSRWPKHCVVTPRVAATPWLVDGWGQGDKSLAERVCFFPGMILRPGPMSPRNSRAVSNASSPAGSATRVASRDPSGSGVWPAALKADLSFPKSSWDGQGL